MWCKESCICSLTCPHVQLLLMCEWVSACMCVVFFAFIHVYMHFNSCSLHSCSTFQQCVCDSVCVWFSVCVIQCVWFSVIQCVWFSVCDSVWFSVCVIQCVLVLNSVSFRALMFKYSFQFLAGYKDWFYDLNPNSQTCSFSLQQHPYVFPNTPSVAFHNLTSTDFIDFLSNLQIITVLYPWQITSVHWHGLPQTKPLAVIEFVHAAVSGCIFLLYM